jgi:hypothetical protein
VALPTFFIIGAAKAGTTSLHFYLDQHPEIQMSAVKEPHFFAGPENGLPFPPERIDDAGEYDRLFDASFPVRGEASPSYSNAPLRSGVPGRIKERVPDAKFIYLVRDPIERTLSHYRHAYASGRERRTLAEAVAEIDDPRSYLACHSLYGRQLELYLDEFPLASTMVVDQRRLRDDREAVLRDVFAFLEVAPDFRSERFAAELWRTAERRVSPPGQAHLLKRTLGRRLRRLPQPVRSGARRAWERAFWRPLEETAMDDATRRRLHAFYQSDVARLRELTRQPFADWSV